MAEMKFDCPHCSQPIACDELWGGHQIECPICKKELMVPHQGGGPAEAAASLVPKPPTTAAPKLSISHATHKPAAPSAPAQPPPGAAPNRTIASMSQQKQKQKSAGAWMKYVWIAVVLGVLGAAAYFAMPMLKKWQDKATADKGDGSAGQVGHISELNSVLDATDPSRGGSMSGGSSGAALARAKRASGGGAPGAPAPSLPVIAPAYSLDPASITIADSQVNGLISGTNFVAENCRLDGTGSALVLQFFQGTQAAPDREIIVYLHLKAGEKIDGRTFTITPDMKGAGVPGVAKRWKADPRYAPRLQNYATGYAMKLELGQMAGGKLPGKIFIALPDPEKSVIAGVFQATSSLPDSPPPAAAAPAANKPPPSAIRATAPERYGVAP